MAETPDILKKIVRRKVEEVAARAKRLPLREVVAALKDAGPTRGFADALDAKIAAGQPAVIAEIKKASPSKGVLAGRFSARGDRRELSDRGARPACRCSPMSTSSRAAMPT